MRSQEKQKLTYATRDLPFWKRQTIRLIERFGGQRKLYKIYNDFLKRNTDPCNFWIDAVFSLKLQIKSSGNTASSIPSVGGLLVISNHPYGVVDGVALASLISQRRKDFKVIAWDLFCHPENAAEHLLAMDLSANSLKARKQNVTLRRKTVEYLKSGGCVILFPSGMLEITETFWSPPVEAPWTNFMTSIALSAGVPVMPMFVIGHNSRLFYMASKVSQTLRLAMLFNETNRKVGSTIEVVVGRLFSAQKLASMGNHDTITNYLRTATLELETKAPPYIPPATSHKY